MLNTIEGVGDAVQPYALEMGAVPRERSPR